MKTPRRWMALAAAIALLTLLLLPVERAAAAGIKFWTPPNEEYFGDPDTPSGPVAFAWWLGGRVSLAVVSRSVSVRSGTLTVDRSFRRAGTYQPASNSPRRSQVASRGPR